MAGAHLEECSVILNQREKRRFIAKRFKIRDAVSTKHLQDVFPERFTLNVVSDAEEGSMLMRDCLFITPDSRHIIGECFYEI